MAACGWLDEADVPLGRGAAGLFSLTETHKHRQREMELWFGVQLLQNMAFNHHCEWDSLSLLLSLLLPLSLSLSLSVGSPV